jgi:hypothetical protein
MAETVETPAAEVQTPATPQFAQGSMSELDALLEGRIQPQVSTPAAESKVETTEVKPETVTEVKPVENTPISLEDETSTETKATPTDVKTEDDFDKRYRAKLKEDFGDDVPDNIKTKLNTPVEATYKTEFAKLADKYLPSGMSQSDFINFVATDFTKMEPIDLLDFKLSQESPTLTSAERELILADKYKLYEDATPQEVAVGKYNMEKDSKAALGEYQAVKESLIKDKFDPATPPIPDPAYVEAQSYWKKEAANVVKAIDKVTITVKAPVLGDGTKTEDVAVDFKLPAKEQKLFSDFVENHGADVAKAFGIKTPEDMAAKLKRDFVGQNYDKLFGLYAQRLMSLRDEQWAKKVGNYKAPGGKDAAPASGIKKGSAQEFEAAMNN